MDEANQRTSWTVDPKVLREGENDARIKLKSGDAVDVVLGALVLTSASIDP